jgi:hypothetical protein
MFPQKSSCCLPFHSWLLHRGGLSSTSQGVHTKYVFLFAFQQHIVIGIVTRTAISSGTTTISLVSTITMTVARKASSTSMAKTSIGHKQSIGRTRIMITSVSPSTFNLSSSRSDSFWLVSFFNESSGSGHPAQSPRGPQRPHQVG